MPRSKEKTQPVDWGTQDEKSFIDGIGHRKTEKPSNVPPNCPHYFRLNRLQMLKKYLDYIALRVFWASIDKAAVRTYAANALEEEKEG